MGLASALGFGKSNSNALKVGSNLTDFPAANNAISTHDGNHVTLSSYVGKQPLVLFFYPQAETPGCTKQACKFRDEYQTFVDAGAVVFGISSDRPEANNQFVSNRRLPFPLLTDEAGALRKAFGVPNDLLGLMAGRQTFVFDKAGTCVLSFNSQLNAEQHAVEAVSAIKALAA